MVVSGHAIIHPRIETELESANSTDFSLIFAGAGGCDPYCSLCGELYMDAFGSGGNSLAANIQLVYNNAALAAKTAAALSALG